MCFGQILKLALVKFMFGSVGSSLIRNLVENKLSAKKSPKNLLK